jgi:hypothetical protein
LNAAWAFSAHDVWAAGDQGALVHWDGQAWRAALLPTYESIDAMWGADPADVWVAGSNGILLHCDGTGWSKASSGTTLRISQLWGAAADDVWALGSDESGVAPNASALVHWDGRAWSAVPLPSQDSRLVGRSLWGTSRQDLWAGGCGAHASGGAFGALLFHWDGTGWTRMEPDLPGCVTGIAGAGPNDVWATLRIAGACPDGYGHAFPCPSFQMAHWNGKAWTRADGPAPGSELALSAPVSGEVWVQGVPEGVQRWNGATWSPLAGLAELRNRFRAEGAPRAIAGSSSQDVWLFGSAGEMQHWDGAGVKSFTEKAAPVGIQALWASSDDDVWGVGSQTVFHRSAGVWSATDVSSLVSSSADGLSLAWGSSRDDVWAVGSGVALHWDGATWKSVPVPFQFYQNTLWGSGPRDVYSGGHEGLSHFDGTAWTHVFGGDGEYVYSVWGSSATDVWMATGYYRYGENAYANLYHFDGKAWAREAHLWEYSPYGRIISLSGTGPNDVWALGEARVLHWDGVAWTTQAAGLPDMYGSWHVWARAPGDVWAPAGGSTIHGAMHFDGQRWSEVPTPAGTRFFSLPGGPLWSFGEGALLRHP